MEIRSSNHKNLDIQTSLPYYLYPYEPEIRNMVRKKIHRGRIEIYVPRQESDFFKLKVNKSLAREYFNALVSLKDELSISDNVGIDVLASQKDIFVFDEPEIDIKQFYGALDAALDELIKSRIEEGKNLVHDITERIQLLNSLIATIENKREESKEGAQQKLRERLEEFLGDLDIDESRLIQETAILLEKSDITEEIVRVKSHLKHIGEVLESGATVGKKMDFFIQELRREVNTIGSKSQDVEISTNVVEMKHELEKIKEQVQNLQ